MKLPGLSSKIKLNPITENLLEQRQSHSPALHLDFQHPICVADEVGQNFREHAQLGSNPAAFIDAIDKMKDLRMLDWIRRMLVKAGEDAEERDYKRIDVEQLIHPDPFE